MKAIPAKNDPDSGGILTRFLLRLFAVSGV